MTNPICVVCLLRFKFQIIRQFDFSKYIAFRVKCTSGLQTYKSVSIRFINFENAFLVWHANMTCFFTFNPSPSLFTHNELLFPSSLVPTLARLTPHMSMGCNRHERRGKQEEERIYSWEKRNDAHLNVEKYATLVLPHQQETSTWLAWTCNAPLNKFRDPRMHF